MEALPGVEAPNGTLGARASILESDALDLKGLDGVGLKKDAFQSLASQG